MFSSRLSFLFPQLCWSLIHVSFHFSRNMISGNTTIISVHHHHEPSIPHWHQGIPYAIPPTGKFDALSCTKPMMMSLMGIHTQHGCKFCSDRRWVAPLSQRLDRQGKPPERTFLSRKPVHQSLFCSKISHHHHLYCLDVIVCSGNLRWRRPVGLNGCRETNAAEQHHHLHRLHKKILDEDRDDESKERHKTLIRAKSFGSECFQVNPYNKKYSGSEDCLYLNVWTPSIDLEVSLFHYYPTSSPSVSDSGVPVSSVVYYS